MIRAQTTTDAIIDDCNINEFIQHPARFDIIQSDTSLRRLIRRRGNARTVAITEEQYQQAMNPSFGSPFFSWAATTTGMDDFEWITSPLDKPIRNKSGKIKDETLEQLNNRNYQEIKKWHIQ